MKTLTPTQEMAKKAKISAKAFRKATIDKEHRPTLSINGNDIELSEETFEIFHFILKKISDGSSISILTDNELLTTTQAAKLLGMSRPYFVKMLDKGAIDYVMVGSHKKVKREDVIAFKLQREEALSQLGADTNQLDNIDFE
ncbi:excisionase family DNA-binding protein [Algivirga pacifica]|uniref:Helix-turn-helix domain-containing protein n=1 Tax=Algivirga pacifica TaxID=1162670 RepID=A0ABP9D0Z7_9BACT